MQVKLGWKKRIKALLFGEIDVALKKQTVPLAETVPDSNAEHSAKKLLAILQKQARFIDFIHQNLDHYSNNEVANVARNIHSNCQKTLKKYCKFSSIRPEAEEGFVVLEKDFDRSYIHLIGNIGNQQQFEGVLIHKGWQIDEIKLPYSLNKTNDHIIQPAEIEVK